MDKQVSPITPAQVIQKKKDIMPPVVFEGFNEIIAEKFRDGYSTFQVDEIVALLVKKGLKRKAIFDNHWLDVEGIYRKAGWKVEYDSPAYNESYPATFTFSSNSKCS